MAAAAAGAQECGAPRQPDAPGRRALYFCGSIRGGREDQELYKRTVSRLRRFGTVLTEHVADTELGAQGEGRGGGSPLPKLPSRGGGRSSLRRANGGPQPARPARRGGSRTRPAGVRAQLRCAPSLRAQWWSWPLAPSWSTLSGSFQGSWGRGRGRQSGRRRGCLGSHIPLVSSPTGDHAHPPSCAPAPTAFLDPSGAPRLRCLPRPWSGCCVVLLAAGFFLFSPVLPSLINLSLRYTVYGLNFHTGCED